MIMCQLETSWLIPQESHFCRRIFGNVLWFYICQEVDRELPLFKVKVSNKLHTEDISVKLKRLGNVLYAKHGLLKNETIGGRVLTF